MTSAQRSLLIVLSVFGLLYVSRNKTVLPVATVIAQTVGPRGLRDNNPGNIKYDGTQWQGAVGVDKENLKPGQEEGFVIFDTPENGIRAMVRIYRSYARRGITTIRGIITTWSATDQTAYVYNVAQALDKDPDQPITIADYPALVKATIRQEVGFVPYSDDVINAGVQAGLA